MILQLNLLQITRCADFMIELLKTKVTRTLKLMTLDITYDFTIELVTYCLVYSAASREKGSGFSVEAIIQCASPIL